MITTAVSVRAEYRNLIEHVKGWLGGEIHQMFLLRVGSHILISKDDGVVRWECEDIGQ